jgi:hypothetical protein
MIAVIGGSVNMVLTGGTGRYSIVACCCGHVRLLFWLVMSFILIDSWRFRFGDRGCECSGDECGYVSTETKVENKIGDYIGDASRTVVLFRK